MGAAFALTLPYVAFVLYFSLQFPRGHWPTWFLDSILVWFIANCLIMTLLALRLAKQRSTEQQAVQGPSARSKVGLWFVRIVFTPLLVLWSVEFLRGVQEVFERKLPLNRAIPAGAFLLFFIVMFAWVVYRAWTAKA